MKSVEAFPEYQGDADNIQFLSATEHLEAHGGYFRNPTNGYYNPETGKTVSFGDGKYQKCEVIKLSDPVFVPKPEPKSTPKKASANEPKGRVKRAPSKAVSVIGKVADTVKGFYVKHQGAINTVGIIGAVVTEEVVRRKVLGGGSGGGSSVGKIAQAVSTGKEVVDRVSPVEHAVRGYTRMQNGKLVEVAPYVRGIKK